MDELRKVNKALTIAKIIIDGQIEALKNPRGFLFIITNAHTKAQNAATIPHWCWRKDKSELDKRRYRRYLRSFHATVISR